MLFRLSRPGETLTGMGRDVDENTVGALLLAGPSPEQTARTWQRVRQVRAETPSWAWPDVELDVLPPPDCVVSEPPAPAPKWLRLHRWFAAQDAALLDVDLAVLDELVVGGLPAAATTGRCANEWWTNNPRKQYSRAWVNAGYLVTGSRAGGMCHFVRGTKPMLTRAAAVEPRLFWLPHLMKCSTSTHAGDPFDRPTSVYIIHLFDVELYKVGVSAAESLSRRIQSHAVGGRRLEVVQTVEVAHRSCAHALEAAALNLTEPDRRFDDRWRAVGGGYSETWRDSGGVPDLRALAELMNPHVLL